MFFAPTRSDREASSDPQPSLEARYASRETYLGQLRQAAQQLVDDGYILEEDMDLIVTACAERYDAACANATATEVTAN